jgi:hypothetical protein
MTPRPVQARTWRHGGWYGGGRSFYAPSWWWGRHYAYPYWGWAGYAYPAYSYPYTQEDYQSFLYANPFAGEGVPPSREATTSLDSNSPSGPAGTSPEEGVVSTVLTASGVANDQGRIRWPLGLRILGGPVVGHLPDELRRQLDTLYQEAAQQAARGPADPKLLERIDRAVERFRKLLIRDREERSALPAAVYDEAERYLHQLRDAVPVLQSGVKTQRPESR